MNKEIDKQEKNKDNNENVERMREYDLKIAYKDGILEGLRRYSWWEDGKQYVGTTKKTLDHAIQDIEKEYEYLKP
jgi:uncharacterized protein YdcH (DUF465 family)